MKELLADIEGAMASGGPPINDWGVSLMYKDTVRVWYNDQHGHSRNFVLTPYGVRASNWCPEYGDHCYREDAELFPVLLGKSDLVRIFRLAAERVHARFAGEVVPAYPACGRA